MQIEIDPTIIDPALLKKKINESVIDKGIPQRFLGDDPESIVTLPQIREMSVQTERLLLELNNNWQIHETPISSHRPIIGWVIVFWKKAIRKMTRWLFNSYNEQESRFNYEVVQCLSEINNMQKMIIKFIEQEETQGE